MRPRSHVRRDDGETLVEVLVAIVIMGIGAVAILGAFEFSIKVSVISRGESQSQAAVRSFAEAIQNSLNTSGTYTKCAPLNKYKTSTTTAQIPSGYTATQAAAQSWTGSGWTSSCPSADPGVQRVVLTVTNNGIRGNGVTEQLTVILRKPCNAGPYSSASKC